MSARRRASQDGLVRAMARLLVPATQRERAEQVAFRDAGHGYDVFGANRGWIAFGLVLTRGMYDVCAHPGLSPRARHRVARRGPRRRGMTTPSSLRIE